ncbi:hypothetical protein DKX38_001973 [Salix brachista]|uniref:K-box domain-containing protein n=1 Tax=Salix brachista TaxID=2182728 RepID=A0A5N5NKR2_9ROSI|nr:hypothetical protein DKX38_001973 [Salix brachista]
MNIKIRREIRQRMGQCLNDLSFQDLQSLESDMESAWRVIHDRAFCPSSLMSFWILEERWMKIHTAWLTMEGTTILLWDFEMKILAFLLCDCNPISLIFTRKQGQLSQLTPCLSSVSSIEVTLHPSCSKLSQTEATVELTSIIPDCFYLDN